MVDDVAVRFERGAEYLMDRDNAGVIADDLNSYFSSYTGRHFEAFIARSEPDRFTAEDLAAAATLSVPWSGAATTALLVERADEFNDLLRAPGVPAPDADLRTVDAGVLADGAPLAAMYEALKTLDDISYVRASKLLAAKRPGLVPIRDSVVEGFLGAGREWWAPYRELVCVDGLAERVLELSASIPHSVTLLRRVDVALWMAGKRRHTG